jgi:hypothetical protein
MTQILQARSETSGIALLSQRITGYWFHFIWQSPTS